MPDCPGNCEDWSYRTPGVGKTTVASILSEHFTIIDLVELAEERAS